MSTQSFYWLIELGPQCYLEALTPAGGMARFAWTSSHDRALKFVTKEQCNATLDAIRELDRALFPINLPTCARAVEHGWISPISPAPQQEGT